MPLKSIEIKNFQAHEHSVLELHPGMNVIVGESDSGKTAILRACELVRTNTPDGLRHVSKWARHRTKKGEIALDGRMEVTLTNASGKRITRFRDSKVNGYSVNGKELKAVGKTVPDEVAEALNLSDVNVAKQHDPHFMLSWSPPEVSRYFNGLCGLEILDKCTKLAISRKRDAQNMVDAAELRAKEATEALERLQWVDGARELLEAATVAANAAQACTAKATAINAMVDTALEHAHTARRLEWVVDAMELCKEAGKADAMANSAWVRYGTIAKLAKDAKAHLETLESTAYVPAALKLVTEAEAARLAGGMARAIERQIRAILRVAYDSRSDLTTLAFVGKAKELLEAAKASNRLAEMARNKGAELHTVILAAKGHLQTLSTHVDVEKCQALLKQARSADKRAQDAAMDALTIKRMVREAKQAQSQIAEFTAAIDRLNKELALLHEHHAKEVPNCPTCGKPWPESVKTVP